MQQYYYTALDAKGAFTKGFLAGGSVRSALRRLEEGGYLVVNIRRKRSRISSSFNASIVRVARADKIFFTRSLHTLLESGIALDQAITIIAEQTNNIRLREILDDVHKQIIKGGELFQALERHGKHFSEFYINLIQVGERSGTLEEVLVHLAEQQEKDYELIAKARGSLIYPSVIVTAAIVIVFFMMTFVVPRITSVLTEHSIELPLTTKILMASSAFMADHGLIVLPSLVVLLVVGYRLLVGTKRGKALWDSLKLHLPMLKRIVTEFNMARISRAMTALLKSGVSLDESLKLSGTLTSNVHYQNSLRRCITFVRKGIPLTEVLVAYPHLYPSMTSRMIDVGEKTGKLDVMFDRLARHYERSVAHTLNNLSTVIEPFLLIFIGLLIGLIGVAILTPIWKFTETL